jgi:CelD/BcsL family acetyltransferase involved in cellulose biosynthesis
MMPPLFSLKLFLGLSSIARSVHREAESPRVESDQEALEADWRALCQDGLIVQHDLGEAWRRVKTAIDAKGP